MANFFEDESFTSEHTANLLNKGFIDGFVDLSDNSSTAVGAGAVSGSGGAVVNAATGLGSVANAGSGSVNQASGEGQIISNSAVGQNISHSPGAISVGHDAQGAFNTGVVHGVQSGGPAIGNVVGHGNETATVLGDASGSAFGFGHSTAGAASGNTVFGDGALSGVGGAQNQSHIIADHGSAVGGHDAVGHNVEDHHLDVHETNLTHIEDSTNVTSAQGHSLAEGHQHFAPTHVDIDHSQLAGDDITDINEFFHH
jgi:hypothetical protein